MASKQSLIEQAAASSYFHTSAAQDDMIIRTSDPTQKIWIGGTSNYGLSVQGSNVVATGNFTVTGTLTGGGGMLAYLVYTSSVNTAVTGTGSDLNAGLTVTFTAPASGRVLVRLSAVAGVSQSVASANYVDGGWVLRSGGANVANTSRIMRTFMSTGADNYQMCTYTAIVTGLTPGSSYTYVWGQFSEYGKFRTLANVTNDTGTYNAGPAIMEVWTA